jgi:phage replication O-like protein O
MINPWKELSRVNPQRNNGHRRVNNDIWQALTKARLPGSVYQIIMYIIDRSWGFDKPSANISLTQFKIATRLSKQGVIWALREAENRHIIVRQHSVGAHSEYLFNKHYDTWLNSTEPYTSIEHCTGVVQNTIPTSIEQCTGTSSEAKASCKPITETIQKDLYNKYIQKGQHENGRDRQDTKRPTNRAKVKKSIGAPLH